MRAALVRHSSIDGCVCRKSGRGTRAHEEILHGPVPWLRAAEWQRIAKPGYLDPLVVLVLKSHAKRRHPIPKPRYRVTNWAEYDAALKRRGSLTSLVYRAERSGVAGGAAEEPGGQPHYSTLAITTALTLRYRSLPWRCGRPRG